MAKRAAAPKGVDPAAVDAEVRHKLLVLASADGPMRLEPKKDSDHPPLFPPRPAGAVKEALARVKGSQKPLVTAVGTGKGESARLTAAGFELIADAIPAEKVGPVARELAADLPAADRAEFLNEIVRRTPLARAELLPALEAATEVARVEAEARVTAARQRREAEDASLAAAERWKELVVRGRRDRIEALKQELLAEGGTVPPVPPPPPAPDDRAEPRWLPVANDREELTFRREVAGRLVSTWLESYRLDKPEGRQFLEAAMGNVGAFRQVGEVDEQLRFDGQYHESDREVTTGDPVRVVRPGWVLDEENGEYQLVATKVTPLR